jgi:hypothetical protein
MALQTTYLLPGREPCALSLFQSMLRKEEQRRGRPTLAAPLLKVAAPRAFAFLHTGGKTVETEEYAAGHPARLLDDRGHWQIGRDVEAQARGERRSGCGSIYCCPECGGVLWEMSDDGVHFFECHTGHTYSPRLLLRQKTESLESLLFATVRALTEKATLSRQLSAMLLGE